MNTLSRADRIRYTLASDAIAHSTQLVAGEKAGPHALDKTMHYGLVVHGAYRSEGMFFWLDFRVGLLVARLAAFRRSVA